MGFALIALVVFAGLVAMAIRSSVRTARTLGSPTRSDDALRRGKVLLHLRRGEPNARWHKRGRATKADGLSLLFEADDGPAAEAMLYLPGLGPRAARVRLSNSQCVTLPADFQTFHAASGRYACLLELRGVPEVVGRMVQLGMVVDGRGNPVGVKIRNEDSRSPAVGGWIEIESLAVVEVPSDAGCRAALGEPGHEATHGFVEREPPVQERLPVHDEEPPRLR